MPGVHPQIIYTNMSVQGAAKMLNINQPTRQSIRQTKQISYMDLDSSQQDMMDEAPGLSLKAFKEANKAVTTPKRRVVKFKTTISLTATTDEQPFKAPTKLATRKRKAAVVEVGSEDEEHTDVGKPTKKRKKASDDEEKRLKRLRKAAPLSFKTYQERALTERLFVLGRERGFSTDCPHGTPDCPEEIVKMAGSTGNVYDVRITHQPTCTCPNFVKGNPQCKHIINVLVKVLKAPAYLNYQLAFLTSELREIFDHAGPLPSETAADSEKDGNRKPCEGDCPICVEELGPEGEAIVWCMAACGNNLHKSCFDQWAATKAGGKVTCPYCRVEWQGAKPSTGNISTDGPVGAEGYVNVAQQLGLSGRRDVSTYHSVWVRTQVKAGGIDPNEVENLNEHYSYGRYA